MEIAINYEVVNFTLVENYAKKKFKVLAHAIHMTLSQQLYTLRRSSLASQPYV